jgi:hypothetical protein
MSYGIDRSVDANWRKRKHYCLYNAHNQWTRELMWADGGLSVETKTKDGKCLLWSLGTQLEDKSQWQKALQYMRNECDRFRHFFTCDMIRNNLQLRINTRKGKEKVPDK